MWNYKYLTFLNWLLKSCKIKQSHLQEMDISYSTKWFFEKKDKFVQRCSSTEKSKKVIHYYIELTIKDLIINVENFWFKYFISMTFIYLKRISMKQKLC